MTLRVSSYPNPYLAIFPCVYLWSNMVHQNLKLPFGLKYVWTPIKGATKHKSHKSTWCGFQESMIHQFPICIVVCDNKAFETQLVSKNLRQEPVISRSWNSWLGAVEHQKFKGNIMKNPPCVPVELGKCITCFSLAREPNGWTDGPLPSKAWKALMMLTAPARIPAMKGGKNTSRKVASEISLSL